MKLKSIVVLAMLALFIFGPAAAQGLITSAAVPANVRSGPGTEWRILGMARAGTTIALDGQAYGGNWVRGITSGGLTGWMYRENLTIDAGAAAALPPVYLETPFTLPAPAQEGGFGGGGGTVFTANVGVNLRSGPGVQWRLLGTLDAGQPLNVDGTDFSKTWIRGITPGGVVGWALAENLSGGIGGLPVVRQDSPFGLGAPSAGEAAAPAAPEAPAPGAPVVNTAPVSGFNLGGHVLGLSGQTIDWMRVAGMSWVKKQVIWEPGNDPGGVRGMIDEAHGHGFRIMLSIVGKPHRVTEGGYFEQYAAYVGGVAAQGADAIEVWNEPNIDREWASGDINPARYTELLRQAYYAIKAANPHTIVASGAPSPTGYYGGCFAHGCDDAPFVQGMYNAGAGNYMDCIGVHYNEGVLPPTARSGDPRGNPMHYTRYYGTMVDTYYNAFRGTKKLCFTELGYLSPEGYGGLPDGFLWAADTSVAEQAQWIDQVVSIAAGSGKVLVMIIWNVDFNYYTTTDPQGGYALIRPGGDCPACRALSQ
jgi:uncharacterized protein YraI